MYSLGLNLVKVFILRDCSGMIRPWDIAFDWEHGELNKYAKYVCKRPPQKITETYDVMRKQIAKDLRKEESEALKNGEIADKIKLTSQKES